MKTDALIPVIEKYVSLSNSEKNLLSDFFVYREIPKNHTIIQYGDVVKEWYFLIKGCVRFYYIKENGKEATGFFFTENMFFTSFESFLTGEPSIQVFESLEPCELLVLKRNRVDELFKQIPAMQVFMWKLLEERFINAQRVVASYILYNPEERYLQMFKSNPSILNRVPQHTLATYLGITPVSLSRIRKRILED